jgi:hypothetical protein
MGLGTGPTPLFCAGGVLCFSLCRSDPTEFLSRVFFNWAQLVGRQWGTVTQKMKKGVEGTNTRGHLRRSRQNADQLSNRNIS